MDPKLPFGTNKCQCAGCGEYFLNVRAFEYHRRTTTGVGQDRGVAVTPCASFDDLVRDSQGYWRYPKRPAPTIKEL